MAKKSSANLTKADLKKFQALLLHYRARLKGDVSMLAAEAFAPEAHSGSGHPTHMADLGSENYEQEFTLSLIENDGDRLAQVEAALARISAGEYGACLECGGRIPKMRLEVLPDTPYCVKCASQLEG